MNEQSLARRVGRLLAELKARRYPIWYLKVHGSQYQRAGIPDYFIVVKPEGWDAGIILIIELKSPKEKPEPTNKQRRELRNLAFAGAYTYCMNDYDQIKEMILNAITGIMGPPDEDVKW